MSWRHAVSATPNTTSASGRALRRNFVYPQRMKTVQKRRGRFAIKSWIGRLDAEEEPIGRGALERRHVEHRVIGLRQLVERPHADKCRQCRAKDCGLERDRDEMRPTDVWPTADVNRIGNRRRPRLQAE